MAELSRLEISAEVQAKSGFVSSVSHELRSPLHGIMASVEFLREITSDPALNDLISTMESCGSTLLDTVDNLLEFAKSTPFSTSSNTGSISEPTSANAKSPLTIVDLAILVEEIITISLSSYQFHRAIQTSEEPVRQSYT